MFISIDVTMYHTKQSSQMFKVILHNNLNHLFIGNLLKIEKLKKRKQYKS